MSFLPANPDSDLAAELTVIGSILRDNSILDSLTLTVDDFGSPLTADTWQRITELRDADKPVDPITLGQMRPDHQGLYFELVDWAQPVSAEFYAEQVRAASIRRNLGMAADTIKSIVRDGSVEVEVLSEKSRQLIDEAIGVRQSRPETSETLVPRVINSIGKAAVGNPTPWRTLTRIIRGLRPGGLYVVAARPGIGKSALALQMASELEKFGAVGFFSLEMSADEVTQRLIAQQAMVPLSQVDGSETLDDEYRHRIEAWQEGYRGRILFDDRGTMTMADIRAQVRTWQREQPLAGIVIDYLQLMASSGNEQNRAVAVGEMSRAAKMIARDFGIPVILLSQLNRNPEARVDKRPALADLRESGSIEQDADVVLLLYNVTQSSGESAPGFPDDLEVIVAKNRQGPTMTAHLQWHGRFVTATDLN